MFDVLYLDDQKKRRPGMDQDDMGIGDQGEERGETSEDMDTEI